MTAERLVKEAVANGIFFIRSGERGEQVTLCYSAGRPHPQLIERIKERKAEICEYLNQFGRAGRDEEETAGKR